VHVEDRFEDRVPALLTRASSRPKRVATSSKVRATASGSATSHSSRHRDLGLGQRGELRRRLSPSMSSSATIQAVSDEIVWRWTSPMPRAAPVTSATFLRSVLYRFPQSTARQELIKRVGFVLGAIAPRIKDYSVELNVGYELIYDLPHRHRCYWLLHIHYTRASDILVPDHIITDPSVPLVAYRDGFGNCVQPHRRAARPLQDPRATRSCGIQASPIPP